VGFTNEPEAGKLKMAGGTFCPGNYVPWKEAALYDRTVFTPSKGGLRGWGNNLGSLSFLSLEGCSGRQGSI